MEELTELDASTTAEDKPCPDSQPETALVGWFDGPINPSILSLWSRLRALLVRLKSTGILVYIGLGILPFTIFYKAIGVKNIFWGDGAIATQVFPRLAFDQARLHQSLPVPLWNFSVQNGIPWACGEASSDYPIVYLLLSLFEVDKAHALIVFLHLVAACLGMSLLCRRLNFSWAASMLTSLLFLCSGGIPMFLITGQYNALVCWSLTPLTTAAAIGIAEDEKWSINSIILSGLLALSFLTGQLWLCVIALLLGSIAFFSRLPQEKSNSSRIISYFASCAVAVLLTLPSILCRSWVALDPDLSSPLLSKLTTLNPWAFFTALHPFLFDSGPMTFRWTNWFNGYSQIGCSGLLLPLCLYAIDNKVRLVRRTHIVLALVVGLLACLFHAPSLGVLLPQGQQWALLLSFGAVVFCGSHINSILTSEQDTVRRGQLLWLAGLGLTLVGLSYLRIDDDSTLFQIFQSIAGPNFLLTGEQARSVQITLFIRLLASFFFCSGFVLVLSLRSFKTRAVVLFLIIWTEASMNLYPRMASATPHNFVFSSAMAAFSKSVGPNYKMACFTSLSGQSLAHGCSEILTFFAAGRTFSEAYTKAVGAKDYTSALTLGDFTPLMRDLGCRYLVLNQSIDGAPEEIQQRLKQLRPLPPLPEKDAFIYEVPNPRGPVFIVTEAPNHSYDWQDSVKASAGQDVNLSALGSSEELFNTQCDPSFVQAQVRLTQARLVGFRSTFSPLLIGYLDGKAVPVESLSEGLACGVRCPPGEHEIRLGFATVPTWVVTLQWVSVTGWLLAAVALLIQSFGFRFSSSTAKV